MWGVTGVRSRDYATAEFIVRFPGLRFSSINRGVMRYVCIPIEREREEIYCDRFEVEGVEHEK